jgi:GNAT superfamily N-acetyltransferase
MSISTPVTILPASLSSPAAQLLIPELNAELLSQYPGPGECSFDLTAEEVAWGCFLVAYLDLSSTSNNDDTNSNTSTGSISISTEKMPIGCTALRRLPSSQHEEFSDLPTGEVKRMYVRASFRGKRIGRLLLREVERKARELGLRRLVLETGDKQVEALGLYEREAWGEYRGKGVSVCFEKVLD